MKRFDYIFRFPGIVFPAIAIFGLLFLFTGCDKPARPIEYLGTRVEKLPELPDAPDAYPFPEIEGHEDCRETGDEPPF